MNPDVLNFLESFLGAFSGCDSIRDPDPQKVPLSQKKIEELAQRRGRPLIYPMLPSGKGSGPFVEMLDGSVKMDLICGIGVHLFGHGHPALILEGVKAALKATTMQGTLMPGLELSEVLGILIRGAKDLEHLSEKARAPIEAGWMTTCGTMANELALKIIRQKKYPRYKLISFKNCFAGRSTTMQELTDEPKYREGQPTFGQFSYIDFYDSRKSLEENIRLSIEQVEALLKKEPEAYCGFGFEIVQGEGGGFRSAPTDWWRALLSYCRSQDLALWHDEVQTFARTGELFAFQRFEIGDFVDVVSLAKPLQAGAVLWTKDYAPKPGLIAGTFGGGTVNLAIGYKIVQMLIEGSYLGPEGKIRQLENFILKDWEERKSRLKNHIPVGEAQVTGGMIAFEVLDGEAETIKKFLNFLFEKGIIAFSAGRKPVVVRFLPPVGILSSDQWKMAMDLFEKTLVEFWANFQKPQPKSGDLS